MHPVASSYIYMLAHYPRRSMITANAWEHAAKTFLCGSSNSETTIGLCCTADVSALGKKRRKQWQKKSGAKEVPNWLPFITAILSLIAGILAVVKQILS